MGFSCVTLVSEKESMKGLKFYEKEEAENTFASDDSDIQEEERREYDEHFWCKDKDVKIL